MGLEWELTGAEQSVLEKGLNSAVMPAVELITTTGTACKHLSRRVHQHPKQTKLRKPNLRRESFRCSRVSTVVMPRGMCVAATEGQEDLPANTLSTGGHSEETRRSGCVVPQ